ncbi:condensation domain-containing protein [Amycolatopsis sp. NPDC051045]|uniref:condensation domain-containing protein n=1 Tax=Amycolatopsis sp. NPDC051045 TaxID=3156922 RepID=UPI00343F749D
MTDSAAVAVIGVAFEFPRCADWDSLTAMLADGRDAMGPMPPGRVERTGIATSEADRDGGWIDGVTGFDHRYFGVSRAEAELIDPRQRRMLQLAVAAIGDAGYAPGELAGTNTAVLVGGYGGPHASLADLLPPEIRAAGAAATGSLHAYAAGRIAYHLDLRGPALVVDTSCSSFLVALHEARAKLARRESDVALVGGYELVLGDPPRRGGGADGLGVLSATDRCRPFDRAADGTAYGEGGGFVVLKPLAAALADGDTVHAVLRGSAVNQDARRSTGLTVPSPVAQAAVITAALRDAARTPPEIGYVEAHGTGTKIGDPIEVEGLAAALAGASPLVSSVKGTFGHLGCMAGFAGLVRILAQFRAGEIFPTAHFEAPNPLLPVLEPPIRISARREPWPAGDAPRCAGISSFGLSGTNAHVIVEDGPAPEHRQAEITAEQLIVLSARTEDGLRQVAEALRNRIAQDVAGFDIAAAAEVLTSGREHFAHRQAWVASDAKDLLDQLAGPWPVPHAGSPLPVALAMGSPVDVPPGLLRDAAADFAGFAEVVAEAAAVVPEAGWTAAQRGLVWLLGAHRVLADAGVRPAVVLAHGLGAVAARVRRGEQDLAGALTADVAEPSPPDRAALERALAGAGDPCVLDLAPGSALTGVLPAPPSATGLLEALRALYLAGHDLDWRGLRGRCPHHRLRLPVAPLAEEHCWPVLAPPVPLPTSETAPEAPQEVSVSVADAVLAFAREVLKEPALGLDDDFFAVGGNSLNGTQLVARINERFGTDVEVLDLFDHGDLASLAEAVAGEAGEAEPEAAPDQDPVSVRSLLSGEQLAIWAGYRLEPEAPTYHLPAALLLDADPGLPALSALLTALAARHPMLRARLEDDPDGTPRQVVAAPEAVHPEAVDLDLTAFPESSGRRALLGELRALVAEPLSPYAAAGRYQLVRARFADRTSTVLLLTFHHLFVDGWSWRLLFADLDAGTPLADGPARHYFAHVADQQSTVDGPAGAGLVRFWTDYLDGSRYVPLPTDESAAGDGHDELAFPVGREVAAGLRRLSGRRRWTPNMVLLAAWAALLWRLTGEEDICVAVPSAGRRPADEPVVGNYATTLVVRVRVRPGEPFTALVDAVRTASLKAVEHQGLPTDRLRRIARPGSTDPLAATVFGFSADVAPLTRLGPDGPAVELLDIGQGGQAFPVGLALLEYGTELRGRLQYDTGAFLPATVRAWLDAYLGLLGRVVAEDAGFPVGSVDGPPGPAAERSVALGQPGADHRRHVGPRTPTERRLATLWQQRFGPGPIGVLDDFLEAGGDSMIAIALASAASTAGLALRPKHILELRTIEAIARAVDEADPALTPAPERPAAVTDDTSTGVGAAPAQLEFLTRGVPRPDHWNHGVRYTLRRSVGKAALDDALAELARRHPALRTRLRPADGSWVQLVAPEPPPVTEFDLREVPAAGWARAVHDAATGLHETLSLADGPVCRAGVFRRGGSGPHDLVLVVHHAVVDLYSWNVLTEELAALLDGTPLPPPGPDFATWAGRLAATVRAQPGLLDAGYWLDRSWSAQHRPLPPGDFGGEGTTRELTAEYPLPGAAPGYTRYEQLLAVLGGALQQWLGVRGGEVAIQLVGHGREDLSGEFDLGRTVGFFTASHPFALSLPGRRPAAAHTAAVAAELRSVPRSGFDFEAARRLHPDAAVRDRLAAIPAPALLFSFWGAPAFLAAGADDPAGPLGDVRTDLVGQDRPDDMPRACGLEIYPSVTGDRLRVSWRYSGDLLAEASVRQLADAFRAALGRFPNPEEDEGVENA